jgi:hypothetical protein
MPKHVLAQLFTGGTLGRDLPQQSIYDSRKRIHETLGIALIEKYQRIVVA